MSEESCGTWRGTSFCNAEPVTGTVFPQIVLMSDGSVVFSTVKMNFSLKCFGSMVTTRNYYEYSYLQAW